MILLAALYRVFSRRRLNESFLHGLCSIYCRCVGGRSRSGLVVGAGEWLGIAAQVQKDSGADIYSQTDAVGTAQHQHARSSLARPTPSAWIRLIAKVIVSRRLPSPEHRVMTRSNWCALGKAYPRL